jgi:transcriptional regulator with XRE-family HTH domain
MKQEMMKIERAPSDTRLPSAKEIGRRLKKMRLRLGLELPEAAERSGVSAETIALLEETGQIELTDVIALMRALTHDTSLEHAFTVPKFSSTVQMARYAEHGP